MKKKIIGINVIILFLLISMTIFPIMQKMDYQVESTTEKLTTIATASSDPDIQVLWSRTWDNGDTEQGRSVWGDGVFLYTLGFTGHYGAYDFALLKWDADGNLIWNRTWGGVGDDYGLSVWGNGTYVYTLGFTRSFGAGESDFALLKWDTDGNIIWNRTWGGANGDEGHSIWSDGVFLYTLGGTTSFGAGYCDFALLKWDTDGNIIWNRTWGGANGDVGHSIWSDGVFLYTLGQTWSFGAGYYDFALLKWDMDGNVLWSRTWGDVGSEGGHSIWGDGVFLYTLGYTCSFGAGESDFALLKWDTDGNIIWNRIWGGIGDDSGHSIWSDGIFVYTLGTLGEIGRRDLDIRKWDMDGNVLWNRTRSGIYSVSADSIWGDGVFLYTLGYIGTDFEFLKWGTDTTIPTLSSPDDITYEEGTTNHDINWTAFDNYPDAYAIYRDSLEVASGYWISGVPIVMNIDGLTFGTYNYTIIVWDVCDNSISDTVIVTVEDTTTPILNCSSDITYEEGTTNHDINWTAFDNYPDAYAIYRDSLEVASGYWISGVPIVMNIDGLTFGTYNYTIIVWDVCDNSISDTVIVTVEDTTIPQISGSYLNATNRIVWMAEDRNPGSYMIYKNETLILSGTWVSGGNISIAVDIPEKGFYKYVISVKDSSGNINTNTIIVYALPSESGGVVDFPWVIILIIGIAAVAIVIIIIVVVKKKRRPQIILVDGRETIEKPIL